MKSSVKRFACLAAQGFGFVMAIVLLIVLLLLPRHPTSALARVAYVLALALLVTIFCGLARALMFLDSRPRRGYANRLLGLGIAVMPTLSLLYLLFSHADVVMRYFQ
jgi:hypothetical protein